MKHSLKENNNKSIVLTIVLFVFGMIGTNSYAQISLIVDTVEVYSISSVNPSILRHPDVVVGCDDELSIVNNGPLFKVEGTLHNDSDTVQILESSYYNECGLTDKMIQVNVRFSFPEKKRIYEAVLSPTFPIYLGNFTTSEKGCIWELQAGQTCEVVLFIHGLFVETGYLCPQYSLMNWTRKVRKGRRLEKDARSILPTLSIEYINE